MTAPNDGGPAFPMQYSHGPEQIGTEPGMTLRDYFAGQALAGYLAAGLTKDPKPWDAAKVAYGYADAMIAERAKTDDR